MHASKTPLNYWALAVKPLSGTTDNEGLRLHTIFHRSNCRVIEQWIGSWEEKEKTFREMVIEATLLVIQLLTLLAI